MISHTYNPAAMENLYPCLLPLHDTDYNEKGCARLALSSPKQKKLSLCIVAWFLWEHRWLRDGQETVRSKWSNILGKEKKEKEKKRERFKVASCVMSPACLVVLPPQRETRTGRNKEGEAVESLPPPSSPLWFGPLLLSVQTRAGPLRPYMEEWMTSPASGAVLF